MSFAHMGEFGQVRLSKQQLGVLGNVDVMMMPVGGGATAGGPAAARIVELAKPKVVIPMGYKTPATLVDLAPVEGFSSRFSEIRRIDDSVQISRGDLPASTEVWVMKSRQ